MNLDERIENLQAVFLAEDEHGPGTGNAAEIKQLIRDVIEEVTPEPYETEDDDLMRAYNNAIMDMGIKAKELGL